MGQTTLRGFCFVAGSCKFPQLRLLWGDGLFFQQLRVLVQEIELLAVGTQAGNHGNLPLLFVYLVDIALQPHHGAGDGSYPLSGKEDDTGDTKVTTVPHEKLQFIQGGSTDFLWLASGGQQAVKILHPPQQPHNLHRQALHLQEQIAGEQSRIIILILPLPEPSLEG